MCCRERYRVGWDEYSFYCVEGKTTTGKENGKSEKLKKRKEE